MMEPALIGAVSGIVSAACAIAGFWMMLGGRIAKAETTSETALHVAAEAEKDLKDNSAQIAALAAGLSLYREQAIEKFVTHATILELEKRLVEAQAKSEQRLIDALEVMNKRFDRLLEVALAKARST